MICVLGLAIYSSPGAVADSPPANGRTAALVGASEISASSAIEPTAHGHDYIAIRKAITGPFQSLVNASRSSISLDDFSGQIIEISGKISGRFSLPDGVMLIVDTRWGPMNVSVASSNRWDCLETGRTIRALLSVPDAATLTQLHQIVPMIASAPEGAVVEAEQDEAAEAQQAAVAAAQATQSEKLQEANRYRRQTTSRAAMYDFRTEMFVGHPIARLSPEAMSVYGPYRAFIASANRRLTDQEVDAITTSILYYSENERLDPRLVIAMIMAESGFNPSSTSRTGAMGLGQLMPSTAAGLGVSNAYDPVQNIGAAVHILSSHVRSYGGATPDGIVPINTLLLTMAAYNAGCGAVHKYQGVPPYRETRRYVRKVAAFYRKICGG